MYPGTFVNVICHCCLDIMYSSYRICTDTTLRARGDAFVVATINTELRLWEEAEQDREEKHSQSRLFIHPYLIKILHPNWTFYRKTHSDRFIL